jgi:hypothetical protein
MPSQINYRAVADGTKGNLFRVFAELPGRGGLWTVGGVSVCAVV